MDVLSDVLSSVRLAGSVLFTAELSAPFGILSPPSEQYAHRFVANARRLILFHLVTSGNCIARCNDEAPVEVKWGDMLLLPYGDRLELTAGANTEPQPIFDLLPPLPWPDPMRVTAGGGGSAVGLVCGFLYADELLLQPLLANLPGLLVIREDEASPRLRNMQAYLIEEIGAARAGRLSMIRRLVELLFVEAMRSALTARPDDASTPLASLGDPIVGKALNALHARPAEAWTVEILAHDCATSRSLLAERFTRLVGCPPMEYLTRWRMQLAARQMLDRPTPLSDIAAGVGYQSDHGFNRTFRRYFGEPPARWRRRQRSAATGAS